MRRPFRSPLPCAPPPATIDHCHVRPNAAGDRACDGLDHGDDVEAAKEKKDRCPT